MGKRCGGAGRRAGGVSAVIAVLFWAQAVSAASLVLSCRAAEGVAGARVTALCEAVVSVLAETDPTREITRDDTGSEQADMIEVTVLAADKRSLTAELAWRAQGAMGQSPPLSLTVSDAILAPHIYRQLAVALLNESDWPQ